MSDNLGTILCIIVSWIITTVAWVGLFSEGHYDFAPGPLRAMGIGVMVFTIALTYAGALVVGSAIGSLFGSLKK